MKKFFTFGCFASLSVAFAAVAAINPQQSELQLPKRAVEVKQAQSVIKSDADSKTYGYTLFGKSMFDEEGNNVYRYGGFPVCYGVDITLDAAASEASLLNIINMEHRGTAVAAVGKYDADNAVISITSPEQFVSGDDYATIGTFEDKPVKLVALDAYGIGYVKNVENFVIDICEGGRKLLPRSDMGGYIYNKDDNRLRDIVDIVYDVVIFKNEDGVHLQTMENGLDFGGVYKDNPVKRTFRLYNTGTESTDFIIYTGNDAFVVDTQTGALEPGEWKDVCVTCSPSEIGDLTSTVSIESEADDPVVLPLKGACIPDVDYSPIVREGDFSFRMTSEHPWIMKEIDGQMVAASDNVEIYESQSVLRAICSLANDEKGKLSWEGFYDPRFGTYDPLTVVIDGEEIQRYTEKGATVGSVDLGPGSHIVDFIYEKAKKFDSPMIEYGKDFAYLSSLALSKEKIERFSYETDVEAIDFGRHFKGSVMGDNLDFTRTVNVANHGWDNLEFVSFEAEYPFSASAGQTSIPSQKAGSFNITVDTSEPGEYESVVTVKTNDKDIKIPCHLLVQEMPDYSAIVKEGDFTFDTYRLSPYVVDGNTAYNSNGGPLKDNNDHTSFLYATFNVPQGKVGNLSWNGEFDPDGTEDMAITMIDQGLMTLLSEKKCYAGEKTFYPYQVRQMAPGEHSVLFVFFGQGEDGHEIKGSLSVSDLSLTFEPIPERQAEVWGNPVVDFGEVASDAEVNIMTQVANTGSETISISGVTPSADGVFDVALETGVSSIESLESVAVQVTCRPGGKVGMLEGKVTLNTNIGDIEIPCSAYVEIPEEALYKEDFENGADSWIFFDDDDSTDEQWEFMADAPDAHSGSGLIRSNSWTSNWSLPFNYAVSPEVEIPEGGANLRFAVMAETPCNMEGYKVFVGDGTDVSTYVQIFAETVEKSGWNEHKVSLNDFAGQKKNIIFLHCAEDCCGWLYLDDVSVTAKPASLSQVNESFPVAVEYFTLDGRKAARNPQPGVYVRVERMADGSKNVSKIFVK